MAYIRLPTPPSRLSNVTFSPHDDALLVSTYDCNAHLYSCEGAHGVQPRLMAELRTASPVLAVTHTGYRATFAGLADGTVAHVDYENLKTAAVVAGDPSASVSHGINGLCSIDGHLLVSSTYGGTLTYFDPRTRDVAHREDTEAKIFAMDATDRHVAVGQSGQQVAIYDVRSLSRPAETRPTGLRYQLAALKAFPDGEGYAVSSLDGRVAVEYFGEADQSRKFAFKCHRHKDPQSNVDTVYPVTKLVFQRPHGTLFTAGGDGHVCLWSMERRKRIKQFAAVQAPKMISHMDINHDGTLLVVGTDDDSYLRRGDFDASGALASAVYLRVLNEPESRPKST